MSGITRNGVFIYLKNFESLEGGMDTSPSPESIAQREKEAIEAIVNDAKPMHAFRKTGLAINGNNPPNAGRLRRKAAKLKAISY